MTVAAKLRDLVRRIYFGVTTGAVANKRCGQQTPWSTFVPDIRSFRRRTSEALLPPPLVSATTRRFVHSLEQRLSWRHQSALNLQSTIKNSQRVGDCDLTDDRALQKNQSIIKMLASKPNFKF